MFVRDAQNLSSLQTRLTLLERRHILDVLFGMMFQVLGVGTSIEGFSHFLHMLSTYLESEWEQASKEVAEAVKEMKRSGVREERYRFSLGACTILFFLLQARPPVPNLYESFAATCGSVQGGAAWILSAMVNSYCDRIRSIGVRCVICYMHRTAQSPDLPLSLGKPLMVEGDKSKTSDGRTIQEHTLSLISNVGQGFLNSNVGKGLAAIGPTVRSKLLSPSLTARVVYKLLWHLLKSHRVRMGQWTQASLTGMVFDKGDHASKPSFDYLKEHFIAIDQVFGDSVMTNTSWAASLMSDSSVMLHATIRDSLGISTLMRLLRFLPDRFTDEWLSVLVKLSANSRAVLEDLSLCPDWQSCLFQFISDLLEKVVGLTQSEKNGKDDNQKADSIPSENDASTKSEEIGKEDSTSSKQSRSDMLQRRLDLSLELYVSLLGHRVREGGEKVRSKYVAII
jgi:hypothetical protein